jgi:hypothetical protein
VVAAPQEEREPTKAPDLMAALEQSIADVRSKREGKPAKKPAAKAAKKRGTAKAKKPAAKAGSKKKSGSRAKAKSSK